MSVINRVTAHYEAQKKLVICVPEWGDESGPLEMHIPAMTMAELNMMHRMAGKKASNIEQAANIVVIKAQDRNGKRLFHLNDREKLMNQADCRVVSRIAERIEAHFFGDMETHKGNSGATQPAETN